jgi:hypothetical protein
LLVGYAVLTAVVIKSSSEQRERLLAGYAVLTAVVIKSSSE